MVNTPKPTYPYTPIVNQENFDLRQRSFGDDNLTLPRVLLRKVALFHRLPARFTMSEAEAGGSEMSGR